jgi:hypothetical protein
MTEVLEPTSSMRANSERFTEFATRLVPHAGERMGMMVGMACGIAIEGYGWTRDEFMTFCGKNFDAISDAYQALLVKA